MSKRGRPQKLQTEHREVLSAIVEENRTAGLDEIQLELQRRTGTRAHKQTLMSALEASGWSRERDGCSVEVKRAGDDEPRYGYGEQHRRLEAEQTYPSCLTDAEWALVEAVFDNSGKRGMPPEYSRRQIVDACCYVVRTGCAWRMLPKEFPPWQNVYASFRRWSDQGKFEQMHDRLRGMWREREGRTEAPTARGAGCAIHPQLTAGR